MNCREFIIEFEERGTLSEPATLHLTICADCKQMSARQTQIWLLIDDLKPVAAPSDFDFHVKAKIANAKPSDFQSPRFLPILRYVLPLSVVVLLLGLFAYNSAYFQDNSITSQIARTEMVNVNAALLINTYTSNQIAAAPSKADNLLSESEFNDEKAIPATVKQSEKESITRTAITTRSSSPKIDKSKVKTENDSKITSRDFASRDGSVFTPRGINLNVNVANPPKIEVQKKIDDSQLLDFFGIETVLENGRRTVKVLAKDKTGERSGVKVGDVIEQINGSVLTVRRGTEKLEITLRNEFNQKP